MTAPLASYSLIGGFEGRPYPLLDISNPQDAQTVAGFELDVIRWHSGQLVSVEHASATLAN